MATRPGNEPQLSPETSGRLSDALRQIDTTNTNFQLVIPSEVPADSVRQQLLTSKSSELLNYRPPNFLEKLSPDRRPEKATGTPVIMIDAMSAISYSRLLRSVLEGIVSGDDAWGNKRRNHDRQFLFDYIAVCSGSLTDTDEVDSGTYLSLIQRALKIKQLEAPVVIVNATNMDKADEMAKGMPSSEKADEFIKNTQKTRGGIGQSLKTLRAATNAQVIMVTNQKRSFSSLEGNNGMQVNHDYSTIDLTGK